MLVALKFEDLCLVIMRFIYLFNHQTIIFCSILELTNQRAQFIILLNKSKRMYYGSIASRRLYQDYSKVLSCWNAPMTQIGFTTKPVPGEL